MIPSTVFLKAKYLADKLQVDWVIHSLPLSNVLSFPRLVEQTLDLVWHRTDKLLCNDKAELMTITVEAGIWTRLRFYWFGMFQGCCSSTAIEVHNFAYANCASIIAILASHLFSLCKSTKVGSTTDCLGLDRRRSVLHASPEDTVRFPRCQREWCLCTHQHFGVGAIREADVSSVGFFFILTYYMIWSYLSSMSYSAHI